VRPAVPALVVLCASACGARTGLGAPGDAGPSPIVDDAGGPPVEPPICVVAEIDSPTRLEVPFSTRIETADVLFLVDVTSSMNQEIDEIRQRLKDTIAPGIASEIRNVRFAVAYFADFPTGGFGRPSDRPFGLLQEVTDDLDDVEIAVDILPLLDGGDGPECQVEGLYQSATGEGLGALIEPATCAEGRRGYPCFRPEATPIVLLFTDAAFHNGPDGANAYSGISPPPHSYGQAVEALNAIGAKVVGLNSGGDFGALHLARLAEDTGSVGAYGPVLFDIGVDGEELDESVVESMRILAEEVPIDVSARAEDVLGDEVDTERFVVSLTALRAEPAAGVSGIEPDRFLQVRPGTTVVFELVLDTTSLPRLETVREHWLRIVLVGEGVTPLAERNVIIRISGTNEDATCE
jgi:hypothetical protein